MKISVIEVSGVLVATGCAIGVVSCAGRDGKVLIDGSGSESSAIYNQENGHYYEFVGEKELTWTEAKQSAASRRLTLKDGTQSNGYLATLTEKHEQELLVKHYADPPDVHTDVWRGGSDASVDDEWRWVTGPEAKEDGGKGKLFFKDDTAHGPASWRPGEPNDSGGVESYLQWNHYLRPGDVPGTWNDQPIDKKGSTGYFVEYGGM